MVKKLPSVVIAAGGTGGHIFPAQALAGHLAGAGKYAPTFITDTRGAAFINPEDPLMKNSLTIPTIRFSLKNIVDLPHSLIRFAASIKKIVRNFYKIKPIAVIGFGGYASFPALLGAVALRIPIMLHESNAVMGRTNRWFMPFASKVMLSFANTRGVSPRFLHKVEITGTPVRDSIATITKKKKSPPSGLNILVIGGSQGAKIVSETVPKAIAALPQALRRKLSVWQQVREGQVEEAVEIYELAVDNFVVATFFPDIPGDKNAIAVLMHQADLVIARAGASTISEIGTMGKPSVLIPFAAAKDNHQYYNAMNLVDIGAAVMVEESNHMTASLTAALASLLSDPDKRAAMAKNAATSIHLNSTECMTKLLDKLVHRKG